MRRPQSLAVLLLLSLPTLAAPLPRATPESQGVSSAALAAFVTAADKQVHTPHSVMLIRHGQVIAEAWWKPEAADVPHVMHSLSKSFTSTAVGLAIDEGKLSLDDDVLKFFPDDAPPAPSKNLKAMRVRDLLTMNCGHDVEPKVRDADPTPWVKTFLAHPVPFKPGTHFQYNSAGTYMLSAIVQKVTGQTVLDYLTPRLFEPLGIDKPKWLASPQGINCGGWGLYLRTEDVAKFGQLYLQKGVWNGKQLVPAAYVEMATAKHVSNGSDPTKDWDQGYGFQFWRCRHGAYRGDGANGQFCLVLPEQDAVLAVTADCRDMQAELNVIWDNLLPAFRSPAALPASVDGANGAAPLQQAVASLVAHPPATAVAPPPQPSPSVVHENLTLKSDLLKKDKKYSVYLPPGYANSNKTYPVLYLLHGAQGDATSWIQKGNVQAIADAAIKEGKSDPMIIVMPDAEMTFYMNNVKGEYPFEDFVVKELIPYVEMTYRCKTDKQRRAVAGLSMGGFGSLLYALHHPDLFQSCYAMSAGVRTDDEIRKMPLKDFQLRYKTALGEIKEGDERITDFWNHNSILHLVKTLPEDQKKSVRLFIDCGDDDFLYAGNSMLHVALRDHNIPHEYRVRDGGHTWDYWRTALPEALTFISKGMR